MANKNTVLKGGLFIFIVLQMYATLGVAEDRIVSSVIVEFQQGKLVLQAEGTPLWKILNGIRHKCLVEISGLELRVNEPITFSSKGGAPEDVLKRLLRHLGEKKYAFEFIDERLIRVSVVPGVRSGVSSLSVQMNEEVIKEKFVNVVRIQSVVDGSQAQTLDLWEGDLIIEYDGVKISSTQGLIKEVKKKSHKEQVEMIVVRDHELLRFVLNGGFIGVRIKTITIPKGELVNYYSEK